MKESKGYGKEKDVELRELNMNIIEIKHKYE
jgi:hypothetical protein